MIYIGDTTGHRSSFLLTSERKSSFLCSLLPLFLTAILLPLALSKASRFLVEAMNEFISSQRYEIAPGLNHLLTHIDTPESVEFSDLVCYGSELERTTRPQPIPLTILCHTLLKMKQDFTLRFHVHMSNGEP